MSSISTSTRGRARKVSTSTEVSREIKNHTQGRMDRVAEGGRFRKGEEMVCRFLRRAATAALLTGASMIACAQSSSPPGVPGSAAGAGPSSAPAAGTTPPDSGATGPGAKR
jgi:hypothetical protein